MTRPAAAPSFALLSGTVRLVAAGMGPLLPPGPAATLDDRARRFLDRHPEAALLAGALPFDREADDWLHAPAHLADALHADPDEAAVRWSVREEPPAAAYAAAVARVLKAMRRDAGLRKVVLARSLLAVADRAVDPAALLLRLHRADPSVTAFLVALPPGRDGAPRHLVGATPELLVSRTGRRVVSHPLAGSTRRSADPVQDAAARAGLLASAKDRREHAMVPEFIMDTLAPHCHALSAPEGMAVRATGSLWHLGTRIEGELRDPGLSAAALAALLHPTPAVCGVPRAAAAALIPALEGVARGFYAGAVGWCDRAGDGAWHVSIRCAEVAGACARLHAGAGIIAESDPAGELHETAAKFQAMLGALGLAGISPPAAAPAWPAAGPP